jgi:hypothetical protein
MAGKVAIRRFVVRYGKRTGSFLSAVALATAVASWL